MREHLSRNPRGGGTCEEEESSQEEAREQEEKREQEEDPERPMTPNETHSLSEQIAERTCKFCNAAFTSTGMTLRHEAACAGRTPEQRAQATHNRDNYRNLYSSAAKAHAKADEAPESWTAHRGRKHRPKRPAPDTPVVDPDAERLRRLREADRERQRIYRAKHGRKRNGASRLERAVKHASVMLNSTGQRVQVTLSLDWDTLRRLLITIAPDVSIDGVTLK